MKRILSLILVLVMISIMLVGCEFEEYEATTTDVQKQNEVANKMSSNQSTPTDINYSLERYNLIRRA